VFVKPETRKHVKGLSDLLDYSAVIADGVVLLSTGLLLAGWEIAGPDMDSLAPGECWQLANRLASKFRLGQGWTVQCDLIRAEHHEYCPEANWPDPVSYLIEQERKARFALSGEAATRLSRYFLTVSYESSLRGGRKAAAWMFSSSDGEAEPPLERSLLLFEKRVSEIDSFLRGALPQVQRLQTYGRVRDGHTQVFDSLLQYVRHCISGEDYPFALPETPIFLNQYLAVDDFTGGAEPQLGDPLNELVPGKRIAVLAIDAFPEQSFAGILRELDSLSWNFRYCQQAQLLDEQEAKEKHQANKNKWGFQKTPAMRKLSPIKVGSDQTIDTFAAQMEADAAQAMSAAEHGKEIFVQFSAKVILMEHDAERLKRAAEAVRRVALHAGFSCRIETIHAVGAWLGSFPGQHYKEKRTFLVNTANMVHLMPLSAPFRGREFNPSPFFPAKTPPLFYAVTSGGTPFRFQAHSADVGHQLIALPSSKCPSVDVFGR